MAEQVHHVLHEDTDRGESSALMLVVLLIAILAIAAFAFFAFNGTLFRTAPADTGTDINSTINVPETAPGATTPDTTPQSY